MSEKKKNIYRSTLTPEGIENFIKELKIAIAKAPKDSAIRNSKMIEKFIASGDLSVFKGKEEELIEIKCSIKVYLPDNKKDPIINLEVLSSYLVKELEKFEISKDEFDIPEEIIELLVITSISNTRGVLSVKVNETGVKNIILPLIHMDELKPKKPRAKKSIK